MTTSRGTALVTGASSGIGAIYADRLARRGYDLILVARNAERLQSVAARIAETTGRSVEALQADLNNAMDLRGVEARLRDDTSISLLLNNAGFGGAAPLLQSDVDKMEEMIAVNVTALTRLTYAVAPAFVKRGVGTIINIASIVAIGPEILNGVYGASKAYVLALTQSLNHELADKGLRIQAVLPGATATDFWQIAGVGGHENLPKEIVMRAEDLVDAALAGLDAGETVTIPPLQDGDEWTRYEAARREMSGHFNHTKPGPRYLKSATAAA
ncbi:SDR family oxidoreductase [Azorhizobium oxalatiphilum]|uniref:SDR family oxidoreductase n=1 Tax=Azorhizobium oxalatiphilum TaxID=980631 RepID=A0A917CFT1_9HYPH|nr:SDR family oxidoreductase [Azorhizobium oxalatiphilum]GGF86056.1 SDR family oxidoreductase [Azorhizobium oxalatiphilum]